LTDNKVIPTSPGVAALVTNNNSGRYPGCPEDKGCSAGIVSTKAPFFIKQQRIDTIIRHGGGAQRIKVGLLPKTPEQRVDDLGMGQACRHFARQLPGPGVAGRRKLEIAPRFCRGKGLSRRWLRGNLGRTIT